MCGADVPPPAKTQKDAATISALLQKCLDIEARRPDLRDELQALYEIFEFGPQGHDSSGSRSPDMKA